MEINDYLNQNPNQYVKANWFGIEAKSVEDINNEIDRLYKEYESVISVEVRNKRLAHLDLVDLEAGKTIEISYSKIQTLIEKLCKLLENLSEWVCFVRITLPSLKETSTRIKDSFPYILDDKESCSGRV